MERKMELITINDLANFLESKFPPSLKEDWDNVGLMVGDSGNKIDKAIACLDVTDRVIDIAIEKRIKLIIAHHPLIFKPMTAINNKTLQGKKILRIIQNGISLFVMHTNIDAAKGGLNDYIVSKLGIETSRILDIQNEDVVKLAIYTPESSCEVVKARLLEINKFSTENYEKVSYSTEVVETFLPKDKAKPSIGKNGELETIKSSKIEIITNRKDVKSILNAIKKVHPYEEPGYEIVEIKNGFEKGGIGRYFTLSEGVKISDYVEIVKKKLQIENIRVVYNEDKVIKKVGLVNGSGASFLKSMKSAGVELFITGDVKYHEAMDALEGDVAIVDIGHYEAEKWFGELVKETLAEIVEVEIINNGEIFRYL